MPKTSFQMLRSPTKAPVRTVSDPFAQGGTNTNQKYPGSYTNGRPAI
jgi:hypothetical protein